MTQIDQLQREAICKRIGHQVMHHRNRKICAGCGKIFANDIPDSMINCAHNTGGDGNRCGSCGADWNLVAKLMSA